MPPLEIGENWIWEVWGEWIGPCNNSGGTGTAAAGGEKRDTVDTMSVWIILLLEYNTAECPLKWEGII